ncbi:MAG: DUF2723 domain-containing protein [Acidobacteria bacterium]|nr:DUF2723 domain-containing protein [Acidobacteriota bacterium]
MTLHSWSRGRLAAVALAVAFLGLHLPWLARTLEDIDSVNFALGVREFDVARHQPHPPGYPLYIALAKGSTALVRLFADNGAPRGTIEAQGLALWSAIFGALALVPLFQFFRALEADDIRAVGATALVAVCPLYWVAGSRPMSDLPGLAMAVLAQALLATAFARQRSMAAAVETRQTGPDREGLVSSGRLIVVGAFVSGLALGMRSQTAWLTLPVLVAVLVHRAGRGAAGAVLGSSMTFGLGVLCWFVPLLVASGGPTGYVAALSSQAGEDFAGVDMLATNPTARRLAFGLLHTFVDPWVSVPLAALVIALGVGGGLAMSWRSRSALAVLLAAAAPYAVFHLVFQETFTTRYALPLVPAMAYLAVRGLAIAGRPVVVIGTGALVASAAWLAVPAVSLYAREGSPVFRGAAEIEDARRLDRPPVVGMHDALSRALRGEAVAANALPAKPGHEWFEAARVLARGEVSTLWFLADPRRTDLALVDPASQRVRGRYRWSPGLERFVGGVRPAALDWIEIRDPGWFVAEGWALTPETAGVSRLLGRGPARGGIEASIRRRHEAVTLLVGGRNLGAAGDPMVRFTLDLDGRVFDTWDVAPAPGFFLRTWTLPEGVLDGEGPYASLRVSAAADDGSEAPVEAAVEQFDLQPLTGVVSGFGPGWHELEYSPSTARRWRWTSERAVVRVVAPGDVRVTIAGESPIVYYDAPATVTLRAGDVPLGRWRPEADFAWTIDVPAETLRSAGGELTLETDRTWVPDERQGNGDRRRLGLRIYDLHVSATADFR